MEKEKWASQPAARPAPANQPNRPAQPSPLLSAGPHACSSRPAPTRVQQPSSRPSASPARPAAFASCRCHLTPCVSRTSPMPARLPVSACSRCLLDPARQRYCASSPRRTQTTTRQSPDSNGRVGQGSCPGHGPVSPLRHAHATPRTPLDASSCPDRP